MNDNFRDYATILGQLITISLILILGLFLIYLKIPGNGGLCDPEQIMYVILWLVFLTIDITFIINSLIYYRKRKWIKYRIIAAYSTLSIVLLAFSFRWLIIHFYYGNATYKIINDGVNEDFISINIVLYENGKFFSKTYQNCENENTGTYNINGNLLILKFNNKKHNFLGTRYLINDSHLKCLNGTTDVKLIMKE